jgi:hypothetical protein
MMNKKYRKEAEDADAVKEPEKEPEKALEKLERVQRNGPRENG